MNVDTLNGSHSLLRSINMYQTLKMDSKKHKINVNLDLVPVFNIFDEYEITIAWLLMCNTQYF